MYSVFSSYEDYLKWHKKNLLNFGRNVSFAENQNNVDYSIITGKSVSNRVSQAVSYVDPNNSCSEDGTERTDP